MSTNRNKATSSGVVTIPKMVKVESITAATKTLTPDDSGKIFLLNAATGIDFTLPSVEPGYKYTFFVETAVSGDTYTITTDGTDNYEGAVITIDKDQTYNSTEALQEFSIADGTPTVITMNGTTKGGLAGSYIELIGITNDRWKVTGVNIGDGILATVFS